MPTAKKRVIKRLPPKKIPQVTPSEEVVTGVVDLPPPPVQPTGPINNLEQAMTLLIQSQIWMQHTLDKIANSIDAIKNPPTTDDMLKLMAEKSPTVEKQYRIMVVVWYEADQNSPNGQREIYDVGETCDNLEITKQVIANKYSNSKTTIIEIDTPVYR